MAGRRRLRGPVALVLLAVLGSGCDSSIVNTNDARPTTAPSTTTAPPFPNPANNDLLANAFDYAAPGPDGATAYYFTSPSKRWVLTASSRRSSRVSWRSRSLRAGNPP